MRHPLLWKSTALTLALLLLVPYGPALGVGVSDLENQVSGKQIEAKKPEEAFVSGTGGAGLNLRSGPWGDVQKILQDGTKVQIVEKKGDWVKVKVGDETGFVHSDYLDRKAAAGETAASSGTKYVNVRDDSYLNVRSGPWGEITGKLNRGDKIEVIGKSGDWFKIKHNGKESFVHGDFLANKKPEAGNVPGETTDPPAGNTGGAGWGGSPCPGRISSEYGYRIHPIYGTRKFHTGIDVAAAGGTPLKSLGPGRVTYAGWNDGYGNLVKIQHDNGYETFYAHCRGFNVRVGQRVGQGTQIATVNSTGASTGNHLHFEVRKNGQHMNPRQVPGIRF